MSAAETLLAVQLEQAGIPFRREVRFHSQRRWRADFLVAGTTIHSSNPPQTFHYDDILVEIDGGSYTGGHRRFGRFEDECDKGNAAALLGYRVLHFTPAMVEDGRALSVIREALGLAKVAA